MNRRSKSIFKYVIYFLLIMFISFLWIGYPGAPHKDFVLENIVSPILFTFITLSWTRFRTGDSFRTKFDYFGLTFLLFFVLVCMIGQTYLKLDLKTAFWNTSTIILIKFEKVITLFVIPLIVGFYTDKLVSNLEKLEKDSGIL